MLARLVAFLLFARAVMNRRQSQAGFSTYAPPAGGPVARSGNPGGTTQERSPAAGGPVPSQTASEPGPDSPLELEAGDWKQTLKRTVAEIKEDRITLAAAGMAYYLFLAIFPAFIALVGVLGLVNGDETGLVRSIQTSLPGGAGDVLAEPIANAGRTSEGASVVAAVAGIAVALWSASSGMVALQAGLNVAYDVPSDRKFIGKRAVALGLIVATALLGGVPSPIFTFGEATIFVVLGWILTVVAVVVLFSLYYYLGPNRASPRWQWVSAGGVVGAVLWIVASIAFGVYLNAFGESSYARTYGTATVGVIALILWLYLSSLAILVGGELNSELERQSALRSGVAQG